MKRFDRVQSVFSPFDEIETEEKDVRFLFEHIKILLIFMFVMKCHDPVITYQFKFDFGDSKHPLPFSWNFISAKDSFP